MTRINEQKQQIKGFDSLKVLLELKLESKPEGGCHYVFDSAHVYFGSLLFYRTIDEDRFRDFLSLMDIKLDMTTGNSRRSKGYSTTEFIIDRKVAKKEITSLDELPNSNIKKCTIIIGDEITVSFLHTENNITTLYYPSPLAPLSIRPFAYDLPEEEQMNISDVAFY